MHILIDKKADVKAKNAAGATALMMAASTGDTQAVRMLLENGAEVNPKTQAQRNRAGQRSYYR